MGKLIVLLIGCKDLVGHDTFSKIDPYVKLEIGTKHFKSRVVDNNENPNFNEEFTFFVAAPDRDRLVLRVMDKDLFTSEAVGYVEVPLDKLAKGQKTERWLTLTTEKGVVAGTIGIALTAVDFGLDASQVQQRSTQGAPQGAYPPAQNAQYPPPQGGAYPPAQGAYPPPQAAYPPPQSAYPPPQSAYPPPQGQYPPPQQQGGYPPPQSQYPPQQGGYPPSQQSYPPPQAAYPPPQAAYPPPPGQYPPPQQGAYPPPPPGNYPPQGGYPPQQGGYPPQGGQVGGVSYL
uniref:C2 domain-containing protein n=1 Tax=Neobodo designis TaxID=312471 RepID=A0A7S1L1J2_NEODS|mmetsp:Transcript_12904/g.40061  ORF Transcript_12904/g.40061 Transcript_12904/m.40061 type:complete len:287 (+) Transcript_12904:26-886(+)|eukprot:CAMPEP_0174854778 /NCGR_PEP_ID=MMETSP1114-20130205/31941_1 /TAXON_ID=312471 /ORGANISM="Neobodo designis, Strain CCAP 1951/1" /LENGTH=286 /DNA_ID=CAMNT_0016089487 /DNA_START=28 /DNA_END=888 /DNA_ORIENTATION=+